MKCCVLFASSRRERSNTRALLAEFLDVWRSAGHDAVCHSLHEGPSRPAWPAAAASVTEAAPIA